MKYSIVIIACLLSIASQAQMHHGRRIPENKTYDFSKVNTSNIKEELLTMKIDSIKHATGYDSLVELSAYVHSKNYIPDFASFVFGYQNTFASLSNLRRDLGAMGFGHLSDNIGSLVIGVDMRNKRTLFSYLFTPGFKQRISNAEYKMRVGRMALELGFGYDVINLKRLQFYPQVALGFQNLSIETTRKAASSDITNVSSLLSNPAGTSLERMSIIFTYGAELDYHVKYSAGGRGIILAARYGQIVQLSDGKFNFNDSKSSFKTSDKIGQSSVSLVVKMYMKQ